MSSIADPSGCAVLGVRLLLLACWDCGFESLRRHVLLSVASVVCYQIGVSATDRSFVQWSPAECGGSECRLENTAVRWPMVNRADGT